MNHFGAGAHMQERSKPDEYIDHVPESLAMRMITSPETAIEAFEPSSSYFAVDALADWSRQHRAYMTGSQKRESQLYGVEIYIQGPGFIKKAISRLRGREPQATAYISRSNEPTG